MTRKRTVLLLLIIFLAAYLVACSAAVETMEMVEVTRVVTEMVEVEVEGEPILFEEERVAVAGGDAGSQPLPQVAPDAGVTRLIIKQADMTMTVTDTDQVVEQVVRLATQEGGYIISQQVWAQDGFRYAELEFAVPVEQFERTLEILRTYGEVTSETASGEDVTEEFVDLESRLGNLRATQERLRELLADAENVEEALAVNRELSTIEEELEVIQGRMQYLANRAAFSTIVLAISPIVPTPTPTVSPTPLPTPTPTPWRPGETTQEAVETLGQTTRSVTEGVIYVVIVCGPWLLLLVIILAPILYVVRRWRSRRTRAETTQTTPRFWPEPLTHEEEEPPAPDDDLNEEVD